MCYVHWIFFYLCSTIVLFHIAREASTPVLLVDLILRGHRQQLTCPSAIYVSLREATKKSDFFIGPTIKAFTPPPLGLVVVGTLG